MTILYRALGTCVTVGVGVMLALGQRADAVALAIVAGVLMALELRPIRG